MKGSTSFPSSANAKVAESLSQKLARLIGDAVPLCQEVMADQETGKLAPRLSHRFLIHC